MVKPLNKEEKKLGIQNLERAIISALDINTWKSGQDLSEMFPRIEREIREAVENEEKIIQVIRDKIFPRIGNKFTHLPYVGLDKVTPELIHKTHKGLLFNGAVQACDGTIVSHDTMPITITQIGACLVSYQGEQGTYSQRHFRKDLKITGEDPLEEVMELLEIRANRSGQGQEESEKPPSMLAQRGLMAYAERGILIEKSNGTWVMGHGNPFPYELLTNFWASKLELTEAVMKLFEEIVKFKKFIFIPSAPRKRELISLGNALRPLEYLIIGTVERDVWRIIDNGNAREPFRSMQKKFLNEYAPNVVQGLFRASIYSPAFMFYAHKDYAPTAALIAIADSVLQEHRGFPMLIDIADAICKTTFSPETFYNSIQQAYTEAGQPFRYLSERETRSK